MSKARNIADLLGANGDVKADRLDEHGAKKDLTNVGILPTAVIDQLRGPAGADLQAGTLDFASFTVDASTGMLSIEHYGATSTTDFSINNDGELEVII